MKFMLDTNVCIYIKDRPPTAVFKRFLHYDVGDIGLSEITLSTGLAGTSLALGGTGFAPA